MRRFGVAVIAVIVAFSWAVVSGTPAEAEAPSAVEAPAASYYLSLGDSLAQGIQPGPDGTNGLTNNGYPDQLFAILKKSDPSLQLVKLGCPGESTRTMISGGICPYQVSQLADAEAFLTLHHDQVRYLTINIGSNDLLPCVTTTIDAVCVETALGQLKTNLKLILKSLHKKLTDRTIAAGMTYYDPYLAFFPSSPKLAIASVEVTDQLNAIESGQYRNRDFEVAQVSRAFQTNNFSVSPASSPLPVNVSNICALTYMCVQGNIHATTDGYALIASTFAGVLLCARRD